MFVAHKNDIDAGHYKPLTQFENKITLVKSIDRIFLNSNVCPHQGSLLSKVPGKGNRVCPYHSWSFDVEGKPLTSGRVSYCKNDTPLAEKETFELNNLIFDKEIDCKELHWLDLSQMKLKEERTDYVEADSKIIMDVFLDVDHIQSVHPGVYEKIDLPKISQVQWHYYDWGSLQLVAKGEEYGAAWLAVYPGTMIEWQPGALFVTVARPHKTGSNVSVFKYSDSDADWSLNEHVWETAWAQDKALSETLTEFAKSNLEDSKLHYRSWLEKNANT